MDEPAVVDGVGTGAAQLEVTNSALTAQEVPSTPAPISKEIILSDTVIAEKPGGEEGVEFGATIGEDYEAAALRDGDSDDDEVFPHFVQYIFDNTHNLLLFAPFLG